MQHLVIIRKRKFEPAIEEQRIREQLEKRHKEFEKNLHQNLNARFDQAKNFWDNREVWAENMDAENWEIAMNGEAPDSWIAILEETFYRDQCESDKRDDMRRLEKWRLNFLEQFEEFKKEEFEKAGLSRPTIKQEQDSEEESEDVKLESESDGEPETVSDWETHYQLNEDSERAWTTQDYIDEAIALGLE